MTIMDQIPEQYRETIQRFLLEYWNRRKWELEQTVLGIEVPLVAPDTLFNSALADQLAEIARMAAGELNADDEWIAGIVQEGIQDLMERLFAPPGLGGAYRIPAEFWETPLGAIIATAYFRIRGDELITITEAAEALGVSTQAISNRIATGSLTAYRDPDEPNPQRARRVLRSEVEALR